MNELFYLIILIIISYLIGSTPTSIIVGRITKGIDIREHGSGNAGGTNVFRVLGWKPALFVVVIDVFKGWLPAAIFAPAFYYAQIIPDLGVVQILCGFSAVLGHTYTIFARFKGGKGVGTLGGMLIALFPTAFPFCLAIAIITIILTGYVSLASILASVSLPIFLFILPPFFGVNPAPLSLMVFSLLIPWFITFTHRSNIQRLRSGEENRFEKAMIFRKK
ncbi:MAG: glycerol-3-phosphate 1-O-acyltransferase PlsY [Candidatus Marinimicrobia bacterium]|jgi:glycerol-3-phosphate acyltransferase PlsY|nr:glycerol-3-phosphate 1-O-acyltransferase PlsY [Candidatus Neomarinimicrobiota bacterium]MBT5096987.1 glycerol-3-phosphate 1-O-acyltransferase PlsY [Candidatus Neomarinimicrobiota bacterium]MBT5440737.1 glycerol-3-phosphate 1-O-acyltransferase PlsY [Candidatus Neomarinimicrobiota bacterium]MBT7424125.1 glycerol-3-phosphate 1-O-acyltransferase PlsY [Candidatus Neomarinimicrobiota bacterium]MBT7524925.1 glycerol-3-phosphate 1-O-acyltransferase PlsY [Candidatus Neomarinimicrobiota bacterium]|tara:strand:+ start:821 stop:1480 length:660 start_codon:yes stop_codon:yes gene_type:complete